MGDEATPPVVHEGMSKAEVKEALAEHRREIENMYDEHRRKLIDELDQLGAGDKSEKDQIKAELDDLKGWRDEQVKNQEDIDKVKGDKHTIVTPPANIPPPVTAPPSGGGEQPQQGKRKMSWW